MKAWKVFLAVLVIFSAGAVTGGLSVKLYEKANLQPPRFSGGPAGIQRLELLHRLERQLDLTPHQREQIETILRDSQNRMKALWKPLEPQAQTEYRLVHERILDELTPAQKEQFERLSRDPNRRWRGSVSREGGTNRPGPARREGGTNRLGTARREGGTNRPGPAWREGATNRPGPALMEGATNRPGSPPSPTPP